MTGVLWPAGRLLASWVRLVNVIRAGLGRFRGCFGRETWCSGGHPPGVCAHDRVWFHHGLLDKGTPDWWLSWWEDDEDDPGRTVAWRGLEAETASAAVWSLLLLAFLLLLLVPFGSWWCVYRCPFTAVPARIGEAKEYAMATTVPFIEASRVRFDGDPAAAEFRSADHKYGDQVTLRVSDRGRPDHVAAYRVYYVGTAPEWPPRVIATRIGEPEAA